MLEKFGLLPYETPVCKPGDRFGRLTVIAIGRKLPYRYMAVCRCDCGSDIFQVRIDALRIPEGKSKKRTESCGCLQRELVTSHGQTRHPLFKIWKAMMERCYREDDGRYEDYGGRGITVCDRWQHVHAFIEDMYPSFQKGLQIERNENDKEYSPENCRWATRKEQGRNKRNNVLLTLDGETHCLSEWSEITGICIGTLWDRLKVRGWNEKKILTTPPMTHIESTNLARKTRWG